MKLSQFTGNFLGLLVFLCFNLAACQSAPKKLFQRIDMGMNKHQVVSTIGGPKISERWQGLDRWTYHLYEGDEYTVKEIHFEGGRVVYVGDEVKPEISAAERDRLNEQANQMEYDRLQAIEIQRREDLGAVGPNPSIDLGDDFREKVYGIPRPNGSAESKRRAPIFDEI